MKRTLLALILLILTPALFAQNSVEQICVSIEKKINISVDNWRVSEYLYANAADSGFNDSCWRSVVLNEPIKADTAWLRKTVVLPQKLMGMPVTGRVNIQLTVDDAGLLFINGRYIDRINWTGTYKLSDNARPGQTFVLAIKAINTGGPMRLIGARLRLAAIEPDVADVESFILSLRIADRLLSANPYRPDNRTRWERGRDLTNLTSARRSQLTSVLQESADAIDVPAIDAGDYPRLKYSLGNARTLIRPVGLFAKEYTLMLASNAHIDCAWLWRYNETVNIAKNTFQSVLKMMDAQPDFTYTQSQAVLYYWMETLYPDIFNQIRQAILKGRWEVVGGMWVEPDCNLISGESWARQLLYGKSYFKKRLDTDVKIGWNPDSFGYNWNMPQFFREAGIDAFVTQKIGWNDTNVFPYRLFWWQAPDGTRLLTYFPFDYSDDLTSEFRLASWLREYEASTGLKQMLVLFGVGDHGGGPTPEMLEQVQRLKNLDVFPNLVYGTVADYLRWVRTTDLKSLPVWNNELYLEYHRGTATTQANTKKNNRESEVLLGEAEATAAIASLYGRPYSTGNFQESWRGVMFNQFHDILPGSSIRPVYVDAAETYAKSQEIAEYELNSSLETIAANIQAGNPGTAFFVFNPLPWTRTDVVELDLPAGDTNVYDVIADDNTRLTTQTVAVSRVARKLLFIADKVPSMGYAVYTLSPKGSESLPFVDEQQISIENQSYRVDLDQNTGWVQQITDKRLNRTLLSGPGNELQLFKDVPTKWDAWEINLSDRLPTNFRGTKLIENGPVRTMLRVEHDFLKPGVVKEYPTPNNPSSFFTQDIILYNGIDRIDFVTTADWWEDQVALKVAFDTAIQDTIATYEIPFGTIKRPTTQRNDWDKARNEVNMQKWCDLTQRDGRYGLSLLNRAKYGGDVHSSIMRLTLLRSPLWPDPSADRGKHRIEYSLYPHSGDWRSAETIRRGYEYNYPLVARFIKPSNGILPLKHSFVSVDARNVILASIKGGEPEVTAAGAAAPSRSAMILRLYECEGTDAKAVITMPGPVKKAMISDFMERDGAVLSVFSNKIKLDVPANRVMTIKVIM